ncbi:MAG: nitrilase-related carbon-nitrogen hydrolase [Parvularculaceae bacterium]
MMETKQSAMSRRSALKATFALAGGAMLGARVEAATKGGGPLVYSADGTYAAAPLRKETISLGVVQTRVRAVDINNLKRTREDNLAHFLRSIDAAQGWGGPKDILFFHEFPISGYSNRWDRKDALKAAIDVDGPEISAVAAAAKRHGCYIVFGSYAKDPDWPNHLLSITFVAGPEGKIVDRHWKARNIKGVFVGFELFTTTIYDVLDRYQEMYGRDAVLPVTRTDVGNIVTSSVQREPELFRAFALKGGEIFLRTASGGFTREDIVVTSMYNQVYTAICNNAVSPDNPGFLAGGGAGGSAIFGPDGKPLAEADADNSEQVVTARIPIGEFRARHRQPVMHVDLYRDVFEAYRNRYPPNLFSAYLPADGADAARYLKDKAVWPR